MIRPVQVVAASASATGIRVWELKMPMLAEARPETPICRKPSMAEALPMWRSKGTSESAAALGQASPMLDSSRNSSASVAGKPNQPPAVPTSSTKATGQATSRVARNICSLANLRSRRTLI